MLLHGVVVCWVWVLWNVLQALLDVYAAVVAVYRYCRIWMLIPVVGYDRNGTPG
jgi:hypothetical protein